MLNLTAERVHAQARSQYRSTEVNRLTASWTVHQDTAETTDARIRCCGGNMTTLADDVLPLMRSRAELHRWDAANAHGHDMHRGVDILEAAINTADQAEVYAVTHKALASACTVIARAG